MPLNALTAISPLDGRYLSKCQTLSPFVSEYGLMRYRLIVEVRWFEALAKASDIKEVPSLSSDVLDFLNALIENFDVSEAQKIKEIESITNHDVKAIEYYLKEKFSENSELKAHKEFIHFACTSEDINNLAYALMLKEVSEKSLIPELTALSQQLTTFSKTHAGTPMLSRTHGQVASPTTVGKEMANVVARLNTQNKHLQGLAFLGKMNGAVGNFNAHTIAYPKVDWPALSKLFVTELGLTYTPFTTQIECHDYIAELFHVLARIHTILIDFSRDVWGYISLGYFTQKLVGQEVGSSTMPHKVNPIDFENAEGNFGLSNALLLHMAEKLPISRWQRDLSDSTVLRNIGPAIAYSLIAFKALEKGINKLAVNVNAIEDDLNENWEVLAEAIQTVMRRYAIPEPYEKLKALTRGKSITPELLKEFVQSLDLPTDVKDQLLALTPSRYTGLAETIAQTL